MNFQRVAILFSLVVASCGGANRAASAIEDGHLRVMTFNVGIPQCDNDPSSPYSCDDADIASEWYGTGLSHKALFPDTRAFIQAISPDIVALQEIFHPAECAQIPVEFHARFICEDWTPGAATVGQHILGPEYQIACHQNRPDKCLAVRRKFGRFRNCASDVCLDHLTGGQTDDCGGGTRIGRGEIDLVTGERLTVVNVHGTSGFTAQDQSCRVAQFEQVFVDILDGSTEPAANGTRNIVLGDLNTDPARLALLDPSAATWNAHVGDGQPFNQISAAGLLVTPTYANLLNIDHVASDAYTGTCFTGIPTEIEAYDHKPIVCDLILEP